MACAIVDAMKVLKKKELDAAVRPCVHVRLVRDLVPDSERVVSVRLEESANLAFLTVFNLG